MNHVNWILVNISAIPLIVPWDSDLLVETLLLGRQGVFRNPPRSLWVVSVSMQSLLLIYYERAIYVNSNINGETF